MSEELSLKETIKKLEEKVSESLEGKSKKPKFRLPLGIRMSKGDEVVSLETNLYETETGKLIWSAFSDTYVGTASEQEIKSFVEVIIKSLSDNQLI